MNEKDNVNYLIESSSNENKNNLNREAFNNKNIFKTYLNNTAENLDNNCDKNKKIIFNNNKNNNSSNKISISNCSPISNIKELSSNDRDEIYIKSTEKLMFSLKSSIDYFKETPQEFTMKSNDLKEVAVKMLKDELDKIKSEKEIISNENKKLKDKIKILLKNNANMNNNFNNSNTNHSLSKSNQNISNTITHLDEKNVPVNKVIESFLKLQLKYDELEKENGYLKTENEDLNRKLTITKKFVTDEKDNDKYSPYHKSRPTTKTNNNYNNIPIHNKIKKGNDMETLIKEQLKCMQKMLFLVQDDKSIDVLFLYFLSSQFLYLN